MGRQLNPATAKMVAEQLEEAGRAEEYKGLVFGIDEAALGVRSPEGL